MSRLRFIESELFTGNAFPPPHAPADRYKVVMTQWWLAIFHADREAARA